MSWPINSLRSLEEYAIEHTDLTAALMVERLRWYCHQPCLLCGCNPAGTAATWSLSSRDRKFLGVDSPNGQTIVISLCVDCSERVSRDPDAAGLLLQRLRDMLDRGRCELHGVVKKRPPAP